MVIIVTIKAPKNAGKKPLTLKPFTKLAIQKTRALIISKKIPKVKILKGKVTTLSTKPTVALSRPNTRATKIAVPAPAT